MKKLFLLVTNKCNCNCDSCYQRDWFLSDGLRPVQDMNPQLFSKVNQVFGETEWNVMGGEPFLYPHLPALFSYCGGINKKVRLFTNLSVHTSFLQEITDRYVGAVKEFVISINPSSVDKKIFFDNLGKVVNKVPFSFRYVVGKVSIDEAVAEISEAMNFFLGGVYPEVILDFAPTYYEGDDGRKYLFDYTKDTQKLLKKLQEEFPGLGLKIEQPLTDCELSYKVKDTLQESQICGNCLICEGDYYVLPDKSLLWCPWMSGIRIGDFSKYKNRKELDGAVKNMYNHTKTVFLHNCRSCASFNPGICLGPCKAKNMWLELED